MPNTKHSRDTKQTTPKVSPKAVAAAVVGVGVAVGAATLLKDKKNRDKAKKVLSDIQEQAGEYADRLQKQVQAQSAKLENQTKTASNRAKTSRSSKISKK